MLKNTFYYDQHSVRLEIQGVPDYSLGQNNNSIGIISSWKLQIAGLPQLQGNKDHLTNLINVFYPYSSQCLYGRRAVVGEPSSPVRIKPSTFGHEVTLTSSKTGIEPLQFNIDDAELSDLIICLDKLKLDNRVNIDWHSHYPIKFRNKVLIDNKVTIRTLSPPALGLIFLLGMSCALISVFEEPSLYRDNLQRQEQTRLESINK
tara:strand:- start:360 stop:971 length:612 start_codon:yes stop_codon:yes gene_type:complete